VTGGLSRPMCARFLRTECWTPGTLTVERPAAQIGCGQGVSVKAADYLVDASDSKRRAPQRARGSAATSYDQRPLRARSIGRAESAAQSRTLGTTPGTSDLGGEAHPHSDTALRCCTSYSGPRTCPCSRFRRSLNSSVAFPGQRPASGLTGCASYCVPFLAWRPRATDSRVPQFARQRHNVNTSQGGKSRRGGGVFVCK
jgi:hypothetical protein